MSNLSYLSNASIDKKRRPHHDGGTTPSDGGSEPPMTNYVTQAEFKQAMTDIDNRFVRVEARLDLTATKDDVMGIRNDFHKSITETQRWIVATIVGLFIGFGGLFMAMSNALKPAPAPGAQQQAPIIINVPGAAPAPAAAPASK